MEYYYHPDLSSEQITLSPEESKHCAKVMHHRPDDRIMLMDGKGTLAEGTILAIDKSGCHISILSRNLKDAERSVHLHIAIAPTKNRERIEWFLEKAIEIGIEKVSFIICERSEREKLDMQRLGRVAIAAMKQSHTFFLPEMELLTYRNFLLKYADEKADRRIGWCESGDESEQLATTDLSSNKIIILIGPEGDFTPQEVKWAKEHGFKEISLGDHRLRTETAGVYACCAIDLKSRINFPSSV